MILELSVNFSNIALILLNCRFWVNSNFFVKLFPPPPFIMTPPPPTITIGRVLGLVEKAKWRHTKYIYHFQTKILIGTGGNYHTDNQEGISTIRASDQKRNNTLQPVIYFTYLVYVSIMYNIIASKLFQLCLPLSNIIVLHDQSLQQGGCQTFYTSTNVCYTASILQYIAVCFLDEAIIGRTHDDNRLCVVCVYVHVFRREKLLVGKPCWPERRKLLLLLLLWSLVRCARFDR